MRDDLWLQVRAAGVENKKPTRWASGRSRLRERSWFAPLAGDAHPRFPSIHRGRSRPGWRSQLLRAGSFLMRGRKSWY